MIRLRRGPVPNVLTGGRVRIALAEAEMFFKDNTRAARQQKFDFEAAGLLTAIEVVRELRLTAQGRCMFCGSSERELMPHRYRPPQDAVAASGETSRRHYWWLAYTWNNLYLACDDCRSAQGAKFPVEGDRVRVGGRKDLNAKERSLLVDPFEDDPESIFVYLDSGEVVAKAGKGSITVETFELNRPSLISERKREIASVKKRMKALGRKLNQSNEELVVELLDLYSTEPPFAALRRQFTNQWVQVRRRKVERTLTALTRGEIGLESLVGPLRRVTNRTKAEAAAEFFGIELAPSWTAPASRPSKRRADPTPRAAADPELARERLAPYLRGAEIRRIEIENFRAIEHLELDCPIETKGNWLMLLGENGAGKTSVLQALSIALCGTKDRKALKLDPQALLRNGAREGRMLITLTGSRRGCEVRFDRSGVEVFGLPKDGILIAGYGSMRLLLSDTDRPRRMRPRSSVANLFSPLSFLVQPREWLPDLGSWQFDEVARALRNLLQLESDQELQRSEHGLQIVNSDGRLGLNDLSDGYKAMAIFALDMMQLFIRRSGAVEAAEGIVLVDELGAHLHPAWQMRVTESLRRTFPRVQFIATTHDPLCLRGLQNGEVAVLRRQAGSIFALQSELPPVEGLAVDQLLTSEHFGLNSTLDPEIESLFTRYYDLLSQRHRDETEQGELGMLQARLAGLDLLGRTRRERLVLEATDSFLAEEQSRVDPQSLASLKNATKRQIVELWQR